MISNTKIKERARRKKPELAEAINLLRKQKKEIWTAVANIIAKPRRKKIAVSLTKISRLTKQGDYVIVPGKVLAGNLEHSIHLAAVSFSEKVKQDKKISIISFQELIKKNPKGTGVKIII